MMTRLSLSSYLVLIVGSYVYVDAFIISQTGIPFRTLHTVRSSVNGAETDIGANPASPPAAQQQKTLGLITFDLDDTLYPISTVIDEANQAFVTAMKRFDYENIRTVDIIEASRQIRNEMDPSEAVLLSHTEIRTLAIRKVMETITFKKRLTAMAEDFSSAEEDLSPLVVEPAKNWAKQTVSPQIVDSVVTAWEMERHHASERHLYPDVIDALREIKEQHPGVLIGAVTDGRANPMLMTFTLMKYFDFCLSWEDDQSGRSNFFKDLNNVEGNAELTWIYSAALEKANGMAQAKALMNGEKEKVIGEDAVWIHVGDDLAYDVGGSSSCGAKTIYTELDLDRYKQTARLRFENTDENNQPTWSTSSTNELDTRLMMNEAALKKVDKKISFITRLSTAVNEIIDEANEI